MASSSSAIRRGSNGSARSHTNLAAEVQLMIDRFDVIHWQRCVTGCPDDVLDPKFLEPLCKSATAALWFKETFHPKAPVLTMMEVRKSVLKYYGVSETLTRAILERYKVTPLPGRYTDSGYYQTLDFKVALHVYEEITSITDKVRFRDLRALRDMQSIVDADIDPVVERVIKRQSQEIRSKVSRISELERKLDEAAEQMDSLMHTVEELEISNKGLKRILRSTRSSNALDPLAIGKACKVMEDEISEATSRFKEVTLAGHDQSCGPLCMSLQDANVSRNTLEVFNSSSSTPGGNTTSPGPPRSHKNGTDWPTIQGNTTITKISGPAESVTTTSTNDDAKTEKFTLERRLKRKFSRPNFFTKLTGSTCGSV